jgi:acetoin utilization protein AcuB
MQSPIEAFMTKQVHTIRADANLADAHRMMRENNIRHLPVLEAGRLVGIVSDRDLNLVEALTTGVRDNLTVEDAMSQDVLVAQQSDFIGDVTRLMCQRKAGSAVIMRQDHVAGIFTTTDALQALSTYIERQLGECSAKGSQERKPGPIGSLILER